ncbi:MAG: type IV pilus modification protein PilV [Pseudohongiellaceae bacterium]
MGRRKILSRQSGVGMVEVLVSLLIISLGFLSLAGLQVTAKRSGYAAMQRTSALVLAHDVMGRMRANPMQLDRYLSSALGGGSLSEPARDCRTAQPCTPGEMAGHDLYAWEQALDGASESRLIGGTSTDTGGLVNPRACITGPAGGGGGVYTVSIAWRGLQELTTSADSDCGIGLGLYGDNEEFRRILSLMLFISP